MAYLQFLLDKDSYPFQSEVSFSRDAATVSPNLESCGTNVPRFDIEAMIPSIPTPSQAEKVYVNTVGRLLAAGVDADGETELMVYINTDGDGGTGRALWVFVGGGLPNTSSTPSTLPPPGSSTSISPHTRRPLRYTPALIYVRTLHGPKLAPQSFLDLFTDADRPYIGDDPVGFGIADAIVFHGLIVLGGQIFIRRPDPRGGESYGVFGYGFAVSVDRGVTWSLEYYDIDDGEPNIARPYWPRGGPWTLKVAALYDQRGAATPSECYVASSDYRRNLDPAFAGNGHAYVLKFKRDIGVDPIGLWGLDTQVRFTITGINHVHVAQVTEFGTDAKDGGLRLIVSNGDTDPRNRFIRYTLDDKDDPDFSNPNEWLKYDDFHGTHDPNTPQSHGAASQQPRSALQGPTIGTILWGGDGQTDLITQMKLPEDDGQASMSHVYGQMTGRGVGTSSTDPNYTVSFQGTVDLEDIRPENNGQPDNESYPAPAIGWLSNELAKPDEGMNGARVLYTPHVSTNRGSWTQVGSAPFISPSVMVYGGYIYSASEVQTEIGLLRRPLPETLRRRPVLVAPGGANMVHTECVWNRGLALEGEGAMDGFGGSFPSGFYDSEADRTLHPPCLCDQVFKLKMELDFSSGRAGEVWISETESEVISWEAAPQVRRFRAWILDGSYGRLLPNKTSQLIANFQNPIEPEQDRGAWIRYTSGWGVDGETRWCPVTLISYNLVRPGATPTLRMEFTGSAARDLTDTNYLYVAIDQALDGNGSLAYPLAPTGTESPALAPHELLTIAGLDLPKDASWLVRVAAAVPNGNWDQYAMRGTAFAPDPRVFLSDKRWPLFTLWGDSTHYVEVLADCDRYGLAVRVKNGSANPEEISIGGTHVWLPESPLFVAIGFDASTDTVLVGFSLGGSLVDVATATIDLSGSGTLSELRFRGAPSTSFADGEVCEFRWFGGDANTDATVAPTVDLIRSAFENLGFLTA